MSGLMTAEHGDEYLEALAAFTERNAEGLLDGSILLKLKPLGLLYLDSRFTALSELEALRADAPVDYLRAVVAELGDYRKLEKLRAFLRMLERVKIVGANSPLRDSVPLHVSMFSGLHHLEIYGCDLSTAAAKGLLELKPQLETLICIDSTDSLADLLADRGASLALQAPWLRLTRLVCPDNHLRLMEPSTCLLPAVEEMDLSRNKLTTVANLHNCVRLRRLDLGFNSIASLVGMNRVVGAITQLILRGNGIHSLAGLEKLYAVEELDLAHNVIGSLSEVARLGKLPSLSRLWLEGNPIELRRNYRTEVLSLLQQGDKIELDGQHSSTFERFIIRSRHKRNAHIPCYPEPLRTLPAYSTATDGIKANGHTAKSSRIADPIVVEHVPNETSKPSPKPSCLMEHPEEDPERMFSPKVLLRKETRGSRELKKETRGSGEFEEETRGSMILETETRGSTGLEKETRGNGGLDESGVLLETATSSAEEELLSEPSCVGSVKKRSPSSVNISDYVAGHSGPSSSIDEDSGSVKADSSPQILEVIKAENAGSLMSTSEESGSSQLVKSFANGEAPSMLCAQSLAAGSPSPGKRQLSKTAGQEDILLEKSHCGDLSAENLEEARASVQEAGLLESSEFEGQTSCVRTAEKLEPPSADSHTEVSDTRLVKSSIRLSANETANSSVGEDIVPVGLDALSGSRERKGVKKGRLLLPETEAETESYSNRHTEAAASVLEKQSSNTPIEEPLQIERPDPQAQIQVKKIEGSVPCLDSSLTVHVASPSGQSVVGSKSKNKNGSRLRKARIVTLESEC